VDYFGAVQQIVTSSGANDAGLFEVNLKDERFLPFEGRGAISSWELALPAAGDMRPFDYATIPDVILHVRYTARQGGDRLASQAISELTDALAESPGLALLVALRYEHATEWAAFANGDGDLEITLSKDAFPYAVQGKTITLTGLTVHDLVNDPATVGADLGELSNALNGADRAAVVPISSDVLSRTAAQAWLVVEYEI